MIYIQKNNQNDSNSAKGMLLKQCTIPWEQEEELEEWEAFHLQHKKCSGHFKNRLAQAYKRKRLFQNLEKLVQSAHTIKQRMTVAGLGFITS